MRIYEGRNIYSHSPCIRADIDLEKYVDTPTCDIPNFNNLLLEYIPTLKDHKCSRGYIGGFAERLYEGTYMAHVIEHICLEIQNLLGYNVAYGKARKTDRDRVYSIIFEYKSRAVAEEAVYLALKLVLDICSGLKTIDFNKRLEKLKEYAIKLDLGPSTLAIKEEAETRGIPIMRLGKGSLLQLGYGCFGRRIQATVTENTGCIPVDISCDKEMTKEMLEIAGIPIPKGYVADNIEDLLYYTEKLGYPVVVKPNDGNQGKGVSINLKNQGEVKKAFKIAKKFGRDMVVEKFIKGKHYRILVVNGKVVACAERISPYVIGNGENTIEDLITIENQNPLRGEGHEKPLTKIKIDCVMKLFLKKNNLTLDYIPNNGEIVYLRENDNLSTGGIAIDVTDKIHRENEEIAINAASIIGLDIAGIDITTEDISSPIKLDGGAVIEINAAPGIRMHHYPSKGKQRNVAKHIVDMLFPDESNHSIPIISITGTNGKTTTTRIIANILKEKRYRVGMACTGGVYIDDKCVVKGDTTGALSAKTILMDRRVEAAVLETARGGLVNKGLGYDLADVGILTNVTEDHLGLDGINTLDELAHVKSLVVESIKKNGYAVLNADDSYCVGISKNIRSNIIYFSTKYENGVIKNHIKKSGKAVYLKNNNIVVFDGDQEINIINVNEIPATLKGVLEYNIKNSLAATAGAYGIGVEIKHIINGLKKFKSNELFNPGRFNVYNVKDYKVVIDYAHNIDGYREVLSSLKKMKHNRLIGVIGVPGDRTETSTVKVGQVCGEKLNHVIIKEDKDSRGRKTGEIAKYLWNGCMIGGGNKNSIEIELREEEALRKAMLMAKKNDIVVVFYEDYNGVLRTIKEVSKEITERKRSVKQNAQ